MNIEIIYNRTTNTLTIDGKMKQLSSPIFRMIQKDRLEPLLLNMLQKENIIQSQDARVIVR